MKNIANKIFITACILAFSIACRDEDAVRVPEFKNAPNLRMQLRPENSYFNFATISEAKLVYDLYSENYDEIESVEISFRYQRNGNPTCANGGCIGPLVVKTYSASDLAAAQGIMIGEEITIQDVTTLIGLNTSELTGGDQFFFVNKTTMKDGRVYPTATIGANDNIPGIYDTPGASFTASFAAIVGCPLVDAFTGNYRIEQVTGDVNWNGAPTQPIFAPIGTAALTAVNPITRSINVTYLGFTARPLSFILLCNNVVLPTQTSGLACSGANINWTTTNIGTVGGALATFDPTDDSVILLEFVDNPSLACGATTAFRTVLRLTKL